jgi:glutathione S-transferase
LADLAAAAHISVLDYFGDVDWRRYPEAKLWYMKLKSRPSFRPLLSDVLVGMPPASLYSNLDF